MAYIHYDQKSNGAIYASLYESVVFFKKSVGILRLQLLKDDLI